VTPSDQITLLAALFNGDPSGAGFSGLAEIKDPTGINFRIKDPRLLFAEAQFKYRRSLNPLNPASGRIPDAAVFGLRTTIKF
jgi:porin